MRIRLAGLITVAAAACWTAGCDSGGGGSSPKAENKTGKELQPLPKPGSPGGGGQPVAQPGGGAKAD